MVARPVAEGGAGEDGDAERARALGEDVLEARAVGAGLALREVAEDEARDAREVNMRSMR